jgi:hypothetical protein
MAFHASSYNPVDGLSLSTYGPSRNLQVALESILHEFRQMPQTRPQSRDLSPVFYHCCTTPKGNTGRIRPTP